MELIELITRILDEACPSYPVDANSSVYYISSHCIDYKITASKQDGRWVVHSVESVSI